MRVLVAHASVHGGTADIARVIADELGAAGHTVDLRDAGDVDELGLWDAAVVGAALYASFWPRRARRFVGRHADELAHMPVWLFSSGPLDDSASRGEVPPTPSVARVARKIAARGHRTFGGRLPADARGFIATSLVKRGLVGDFRDMKEVQAWARMIATGLAALPRPTARVPIRTTRRVRHILVGLCTFTGITALVGGLQLAWGPFTDASVLRGEPFAGLDVPGLLPALGVAVPNLLAAVLGARRAVAAPVVAVAGGAAITIWVMAQVLLLQALHPLHVLSLVLGAATIGLAVWLYDARRTAVLARGT